MNSDRVSAGRNAALLVVVILLSSLNLGLLQAQVISEFLAQNNGLLLDEEGDSPDWIEIQNPTPQSINLLDWTLTDSVTNLAKWTFPSTNLAPGARLVIFASGKDKRSPGANLHTNFKLDTDGEYLALVAPGGTNVVSAFAPVYPPQLANVSYGISQLAGAVAVVSGSVPARVLVPANGSLGTSWSSPSFDDSTWTAGFNGVGYETSPAEYATLIETSVRQGMANNNSCYIRIPFVVANPADFTQWRLLMQYDDGFVAYLNGQEVARRNAPDTLAWNSAATANHPDSDAVVPEEFSLQAMEGLIIAGTNILAIQGLNTGTSSSDFLIRAEIDAQPLKSTAPVPAYFTTPTPGTANVGGISVLGPILRDTAATPSVLQAGQNLAVRVAATPAFHPVSSVVLHYRFMFGTEVTLHMADDGAHQDGAAGDGVFGAVIPASSLGPGQLVRYFVTATDTAQNNSRLPLYLESRDSEQWFGTIMEDPSIASRLPVVHWFVENPTQADSGAATRCSLFFLGEYYDNVLFSVRGQSSSGFPKKGYNIDFPRDHRFQYATNEARVKDIRMLTNYGDKSRVHNALAYEMIGASGSVGHFAFQVRVQQNAEFHAILDMLEDGDDRWIERVGRDANGALYKVYNALDSAGGSEKKTRKNEGLSDLQALVNNLSESRPLATRVAYAYDNLDLPQTISYFVGLALVSSQDHGHKNFYVYRDSEGTGEWAILPWDVDLTWGRNWTDSGGYFTDTLYQNNVLNFYNSSQQGKPSNRLYDLIFNHPDFRRMYLRRLRTVMDTILQPPGTSADQLKIEARIAQMMDLMDPPGVGESDADRDYKKWGAWGNGNPMRTEAKRIVDVHLPGRRTFLFTSPSAVLNGERIPDAQPASALLQFGALDFNPSSGNQDQEYIELLNPNDFALDVSEWKVDGGVQFTFKPGTVLPAGSRLYLSPNVAAFRTRTEGPGAGKSLYVQGKYHGQLSARGERLTILDNAGRLVGETNYPGNPTPQQRFLQLTELMYHPAPPAAGSTRSAEDFEFIELQNAGSSPLSLNGVRFTNGIEFDFTNSAITNLNPGAFVLIVKDRQAFESRYGAGLPIAGEFAGYLENAGEQLRLEDEVGEVVVDFGYSPRWLPLTDGQGHSMEPRDPQKSLEEAANWVASTESGGNPGRSERTSPVLHAALVGGQVVLQFKSQPGVSYAIYRRAQLSTGVWELFRHVSGPAQSQDVQVIVPPLEGPSGFYSIRP